METTVLGIDVGKEALDVVLQRNTQRLARQFENNPKGHQQLAAWLEHCGERQVHVCLEATGQYGDGVAEHMYKQGFSVSVVNPARIKHYGNSKLRRNKTDKADAQLIAEFCRVEKPPLWTPPPAVFKDLQALIRHLDDLQVTRQQEKNRLVSGVRTQQVLDHLQALITFLDAQIMNTKQAMQDLIASEPELHRQQELLATIPGVGYLTAAKLLGEIRDIRNFEDARQLAAYAGVTPKNFSSGTSVHKKTRLSKTGNSNLRKILYLPAVSAKRYNPIVREFCLRLLDSGLQPMEVVGAAMRKLLHLVYGVLKHGRPFDPNYLKNVQVPS